MINEDIESKEKEIEDNREKQEEASKRLNNLRSGSCEFKVHDDDSGCVGCQ